MVAKNANKNPTWHTAIEMVLRSNGKAMHYRDITQAIIDSGQQKNSANPAISVQMTLSNSLKDPNTPFVRRGGGIYDLKARATPTETTPTAATVRVKAAQGARASTVMIDAPLDDADIVEAAVEAELAGPIKAYAMYWSRGDASAAKPNLVGEQVKGAKGVNFSEQAGVYILHDGTRVIYVGQAGVDGNLGARLYAHTRNRLSGRWDRFSWFGVRGVNDDGTLEDMPQAGIDVTSFIGALEAVLIEALEPPQNRRAGEGFTEDIEWQQAEDPAVDRKRKKALLDDIQKYLGQG